MKKQKHIGPAERIRRDWRVFHKKKSSEIRELLFQAFLQGARSGQASLADACLEEMKAK